MYGEPRASRVQKCPWFSVSCWRVTVRLSYLRSRTNQDSIRVIRLGSQQHSSMYFEVCTQRARIVVFHSRSGVSREIHRSVVAPPGCCAPGRLRCVTTTVLEYLRPERCRRRRCCCGCCVLLDDVSSSHSFFGGHAQICSVGVSHALQGHHAPHRRVRDANPGVRRLDRVPIASCREPP